jgi:hypothetical protein
VKRSIPTRMMNMTTDLTARYSGKPMLRLLDAYVLDALGALDDRTARSMAEMAPKTIAALNVPASTWQQAVELSMEMPPSSMAELRAKWEQYVHEALAAGVTPDVLGWTHKMVDVRFGIE